MSTYTHLSGDLDLSYWLANAGGSIDYINSNSSLVLTYNTRVIGSGLQFNQSGLTAGFVERLEFIDPSTKSVTQVISNINMNILTSGQTQGMGVGSLLLGIGVSEPTYSLSFPGALSGNDLLQGSDGAEQLRGLSGSDTIYGNGGNDVIYGDEYAYIPAEAPFGSDYIYGGSGNDQLFGGRGNDVVDGGDGNDVIAGNDPQRFDAGYQNYIYIAGHDTIMGGNGNDLIYAQLGGSRSNTAENFYNYAGGVNADGGAGFDRIFVNLAHVSANIELDWRASDKAQKVLDGTSIVNIEEYAIITGSGDDTIYDGAYQDQISTGAGNDTVYYGGSQLFSREGFSYYTPSIHLGSGNDTLFIAAPGYVGAGVDGTMDGGDGFDSVVIDYSGYKTFRSFSASNLLNFEAIYYTGGSAADNVFGSAGADVIDGGAGSDMLFGEDGDDTLIGAGDADVIYGGAGVDVLAGQDGNDNLSGNAGNDTLIGGDGADRLDGGDGTDYAFYGHSTAVTVNLSAGIGKGGEAEGDTYVSIESVTGSEFADNLTGNALANELVGGGGNDVLEGLAGGDVLVGGAGIDTASYLSSDDTVAVNLTNLSGAGGHAAGDILVGIENVTGSAYGDLLRGDAGANVLFGAAGGDLLFGESGDDVLVGGAGGDIMTGGAGNDTFLFRPEFEVAGDIVVDFDQNGDDVLVFSGFNAGFAASLQTAVVNGSDVVVYSAAWDSHVVLQNAVGRVDASDFLFV